MVDLPPGFRVAAPASPSASPVAAAPPVPPGFRVKGGPVADPNEGWGPPGAIVPIQFKEGTGEMRFAMPSIITDTISAIEGPGKALKGEYGIEIDPETGRPTTITNDMIGDTMGLAGMGITQMNPAASAGAAFGKQIISPGPRRMIQRELTNAGIPLDQAGAELAKLGPDAMLGDLSPGLQARTAAIATMPGPGQKTVVDALTTRRAGSNNRIIGDVDNILGPAPIPSRLAAEIDTNKRVLGPEYQELFRNQAVAVDTNPIALDLDSMVVNLRGAAQKRAKEVRGMLNVTGNEEYLDPNPETLFQTRNAIDGIMATETDPKALGILTYIRNQVDSTLAEAVPGIKDIDAQYAELARQGEAVQTGQQLLDTGRTAPRPGEVEDMMQAGALPQGTQIGPSAVPLRLSQGARAEIDRIIGNNVRDINAMKRIVAGEGNWNRDRLASVFGQDRADELLRVLEREAAYNATETLGLAGSRTQVLKAAQDDIAGAGPKANPIKSAANFRFGDAVAETMDRGLGWVSNSVRQGQNAQLAGALTAGPDNLSTLAAIASRSPGLIDRAPLSSIRALALSAGQGGQSPQPNGSFMSLLLGPGRSALPR